MASGNGKESPKIEIEIATVLLGFLFASYSIILTIPSDIVAKLNQIIYNGPFYSGNATNLFSIYGFFCAIALLTAIPFYLLHQRNGREWSLALARSSLALGMFFIVNLALILNGLVMVRLVGNQANSYFSPISGCVVYASLAAFAYILWLWLMFCPRFQSFWKKLGKTKR